MNDVNPVTHPLQVYNVYLKDFKGALQEVVKRLHGLGRRASGKLGDDTGGTLSSKIFLALRQCVLAASMADASAKKFLLSLQSSDGRFFAVPSFYLYQTLDTVVLRDNEIILTGPLGSMEMILTTFLHFHRHKRHTWSKFWFDILYFIAINLSS